MNKPLLYLNIITVIGMILYAIGIYLETVILGKIWGNSVVNFALKIFAPFIGLIIVTLIEIGILALAYLISKLERFTVAINAFLCFFWILSLYQCAINSFLSYFELPNEPINLFFKYIWPFFWYPMKEIAFIVVSILLTFYWVLKIEETKVSELDIVIIILISALMWTATALSQIMLINSQSNVYS